MNKVPLELFVVVLLACFLLHLLFVGMLRNRLKGNQQVFDKYFNKTSLVAIGPPRMDRPLSLKAKYFVPFAGWNAGLNGYERLLLLCAQITFLAGVFALLGMWLFVL